MIDFWNIPISDFDFNKLAYPEIRKLKYLAQEFANLLLRALNLRTFKKFSGNILLFVFFFKKKKNLNVFFLFFTSILSSEKELHVAKFVHPETHNLFNQCCKCKKMSKTKIVQRNFPDEYFYAKKHLLIWMKMQKKQTHQNLILGVSMNFDKF